MRDALGVQDRTLAANFCLCFCCLSNPGICVAVNLPGFFCLSNHVIIVSANLALLLNTLSHIYQVLSNVHIINSDFLSLVPVKYAVGEGFLKLRRWC